MSSPTVSEESATTITANSQPDLTHVFSGNGQMAARMREFDWSKTPLGPVEQWPQSLKTSVSICLASRFPIVLYWGPELVVLYNDAYSVILGSKHPWALGQTCRVCWAEIWDTIGPMLDGVVKTGKATWSDDLLLMLRRFDYPEECYFSFSFSSVQVESGEVGGIFTAVIETTEKVVGERRLRTLRDLAARAVVAKSEQDAWQVAAGTLGENLLDLPFSILCKDAGDCFRVAAVAGIEATHPLCVALCQPGSELFQKAMQAVQSGQRVELHDPGPWATDLPPGSWDTAPHSAVLLPIAALGQGCSGVLFAAASPAKKLDESYRTFFDLLARQIATNIADARADEEQHKRAEALAELDRAKTLFFSNISHELRTPLTLVLGPTESALSAPDGALKGAELEMVHRNELRLLKLVNTLLDFSRIEAGGVQAVYEPVDLAHLTAEIASVFRSAMEKAGLRFSVTCEPISAAVYVDREMWEKVVLNLLSNAFKYTFEGAVEVKLKPAGSVVELAVSDTGIGIAEEELPHVFERFHRVESARARTYEGTGIGLALVQELVRLHGGSVRVESTLGRGSTFHVTIPTGKEHLPQHRIQAARTIASTALSAEAYIDEAERWLPKHSGAPADDQVLRNLPSVSSLLSPAAGAERPLVLVADDNADMRDYVERLLRSQYRVCTVPDGVKAIEAALELRPALVLADVMMPGLDGFQVLQSLRDNPDLSSTPVILLSARAGKESRVEGLEAGADDYLAKPFTARELMARVATHIKMANLRRESTRRESRLRAEAELERHRLQELLEQVPAAIGLTSGPEHRWVYVNPRYIRAMGRDIPADFVGKTVVESLPEIETQVFMESLDEVYRTGKPCFGREMRMVLNRSAKGLPDESYWDFVYQPVRDAEGQVTGILIHAVEVTDKVLARTTIEQSEERLRLAQQAAAIGTFEWNVETNVNRWTPELEAMYGLPPGGFAGTQKAWEHLIHPDDRPAAVKQVQIGFETGAPVQAEWRVIWPDGSVHWILGRWQAFKDKSGRPVRMVGINIDVTERREAEEARRRLAAIVESSDDAIASKDLNGIVTSWNKSAERMFGYKAAEIIGKPVLLIIPPELHRDEDMILSKIRRGERIEHFETVRVTKSGERIDVSLTISPVKDRNGNVIGAAKIVRNITENKKIEHALRTTEKLAAAGRLAATVAHEINNPLEAVTNLVYLANRDLPDAAKVSGYLQLAARELNRVAHIARQTLGFYRDTSAPSAFSVTRMLDDLLFLYENRLQTRKINLVKRYEEEVEITALAGEIRQAFSNLVSNSIDAMPGGGSLCIKVSSAHDWKGGNRPGVRITFLDTGSGIEPQHRKNLFQPFFTTKSDVGTGLGLWITRNIVEKHQGTIHVRSKTKPEEHGTAFSIFLPLDKQVKESSKSGPSLTERVQGAA